MTSKRNSVQAAAPTKANGGLAPNNPSKNITVTSQSWSGPLPPPAVLQGFNDVVPGSAETIIRMAQQQQAHRISLESKAANDSRLGLALGGVIALVAVGGAIYLAPVAPWVAGCLLGLPVLGLVKVLIGKK